MERKRFVPSWRSYGRKLTPEQLEMFSLNYIVENITESSPYLGQYFQDMLPKLTQEHPTGIINGELMISHELVYTEGAGKHSDMWEAEGKAVEEVLANVQISGSLIRPTNVSIWTVNADCIPALVDFFKGCSFPDNTLLYIDKVDDLVNPYQATEGVFDGLLKDYLTP